jgi:hypothetical protein
MERHDNPRCGAFFGSVKKERLGPAPLADEARGAVRDFPMDRGQVQSAPAASTLGYLSLKTVSN